MTRVLDVAIAKLSEFPAEEQDRIARWLPDELEDEELWARQFATSRDALSRLAEEARVDRAAGRATELDPDKLWNRARAAVLGGVSRAPAREKSLERRIGCSARTPATQAFRSRRFTIAILYAARVTLGYRALGLLDDHEIAWFWVGTHAAYDRLLEDL